MTKHQKLGVLFSIIYCIGVLFFFIMSLQNGDDSSNKSSFLTDIVIKLIKIFNKNLEIKYQLIHLIVRKVIGHFGYSCFLGVLGFLSWYFLRLKIQESVLINLIVGLFIASISELLQLIPNDRGPSFGDIFINYAGYFFGVILIVFIVKVILKKN